MRDYNEINEIYRKIQRLQEQNIEIEKYIKYIEKEKASNLNNIEKCEKLSSLIAGSVMKKKSNYTCIELYDFELKYLSYWRKETQENISEQNNVKNIEIIDKKNSRSEFSEKILNLLGDILISSDMRQVKKLKRNENV